MSTNERFENFHLNCEKPRGVLKAFLVGAEISPYIEFNCAIFLENVLPIPLQFWNEDGPEFNQI